jgi:acyl-ACP thioesterase
VSLIGENGPVKISTPEFGPSGFRAEPAVGRVYAGQRIVRSTDVTAGGRLRLDALARYLQTVAEEDVADSGFDAPVVWLVRRCVLTIGRLPPMTDRITLRTFCSGTGPRWAERTTTVADQGGELLQATAVWAAVSRDTGRPVPLDDGFMTIYGESARDRRVSVRLSHARPVQPPRGRPWPLRAADFDTAGHVNNAISWAAVEDVLADRDGWLPRRAAVEYPRAILPGCAPVLAATGDNGDVSMWLLDGDQPLSSARLTG